MNLVWRNICIVFGQRGALKAEDRDFGDRMPKRGKCRSLTWLAGSGLDMPQAEVLT